MDRGAQSGTNAEPEALLHLLLVTHSPITHFTAQLQLQSHPVVIPHYEVMSLHPASLLTLLTTPIVHYTEHALMPFHFVAQAATEASSAIVTLL